MKNIKLDQAEPGMVLAKDVKGRFGRGLLQAGNIITRKHIKIFKSWGITELVIDIKSDQPFEISHSSNHFPAQDDPEGIRLKELFKFNDARHPAVRELFQIALNRKSNPSIWREGPENA